MLRVLVRPGALDAGADVVLDRDEGHHLRVRRVDHGAEVQVFDGGGKTASGRLALHGEDWIVEIGPVQEHPRPSTLVLAVGAGDRDRFQVLAEKCTELGVAGLVPVLTERARQVATRVRPDGLDRARRRAREACKQSGNPWATQVDDLRELEALVDRFPGLRWYVGDAGGERLPSGLAAGQVGCLIGPEGGLTADEAQWARTKLGATPWCLGAFTLRFDTAAIAAASLVRHAGTS